MRGIDCAHSRSLKMLPRPWFSVIRVCIEAKIEHVLISEYWSGKHFQSSKCAQSILRKKLRWFWGRKPKIFRLSLQYKNLNQGSVFMVRKCAQSIPRIKLALIKSFLNKFFGSKKHEKIAQIPVFYSSYKIFLNANPCFSHKKPLIGVMSIG